MHPRWMLDSKAYNIRTSKFASLRVTVRSYALNWSWLLVRNIWISANEAANTTLTWGASGSHSKVPPNRFRCLGGDKLPIEGRFILHEVSRLSSPKIQLLAPNATLYFHYMKYEPITRLSVTKPQCMCFKRSPEFSSSINIDPRAEAQPSGKSGTEIKLKAVGIL
jgi:hypothetical protein